MAEIMRISKYLASSKKANNKQVNIMTVLPGRLHTVIKNAIIMIAAAKAHSTQKAIGPEFPTMPILPPARYQLQANLTLMFKLALL